MAIQQNVNQILSLSAVFARMSPLGEMAEHKKDIATAKKAYEQQSKAVEDIRGQHTSNQIFPREEQLNAAKNLYKLEPTEKLAAEIRTIERTNRVYQDKVAKSEAARSMELERKRQEADRAREARLKILERVPLTEQSETYTQKLLESNIPIGKPLVEKPKKEGKING